MSTLPRTVSLQAIAFAFAIACSGASASSKEEATALLSSATSLVSSKGIDSLASEINTNSANWQKGSAYVFVADFKGNILAHAANPKLVGKNLWEAKDAAGKHLIQEQVSAMKSSSTGVVKIRWMNPTTKQVGDADVELRRVSGRDIYIGAPWFR